jgi:arylsulfatase A-like enzyme
MDRRDLLKSLLAGPLLSQAARGQEQRKHTFEQSPRRADGGEMPNILWICSDQQRFDTIQGLNNPHIRTPNLARFMEQATTFTHAFVQNPVCSPSRACFLTGRYPHTTGLRSNGQRIRESERLVTRALSDFGYTCGLAGKLHLSPCANGWVEDRIDDGYRQFWWSHDLSDSWPGHNLWRNWLDTQGVRWPKPPGTPAWGVPVDAKYTQSAWCSARAIDFMERQRAFRPWLMSVNFFQPHEPFWPAREYYERYDPEKLPAPAYHPGELDNKTVYQRIDHEHASGGRNLSFTKTDGLTHRRITAAYYAMIEQIDFEVGRMLKALEDTGQADNTVVIYMSDHGEMLGDHGIYLKGPYFYDCGMRVPLMIRWPGRYRAGLRSDALVEMTDLAPTLLEAAGIPVPQAMQGRSLTPVLRGERTSHRESVYGEYYDSGQLYDPPPMATSVRTRDKKLTVYHSLNSGELYDLEKDPGEVRNLWDESGARAARDEMLLKLANRMSDTVDPLPVRRSTF